MPRSRGSVLAGLGEKGAEAERLLAQGKRGADVARALGLDPRLVSFLRPAPSAPAPSATETTGEADGPQGEESYAAQLARLIPRSKRVKLLKKALDVGIKTGNPAVLGAAMRAIERVDEVTGDVSKKGTPGGGAPLFALPKCKCQIPALGTTSGMGGIDTPPTGVV